MRHAPCWLGWGSIAPWYEEGRSPRRATIPPSIRRCREMRRVTPPLTAAVSIANIQLPRRCVGAAVRRGRVPCTRAFAHLSWPELSQARLYAARGHYCQYLDGLFAPYEYLFHCGCHRADDTNVIGQVDGGLLPPRRVSRAATRSFRLTEYRALPGWTFTMPSARLPVRTISPSSTSVTASSIRPRLRSKRTSAWVCMPLCRWSV